VLASDSAVLHVGVRSASVLRQREDPHGELIWYFNESFEFEGHSSNIPRIDPRLAANFREFVASLRTTLLESRNGLFFARGLTDDHVL
jgi:hypothetical protein